ncbi:MAG: hypothetical protein KGH74_00895 [Candidatus Micrarchaeota archaeon]|nr:hypothetical protein [Candidatus Micrarchaeota archaeon]
MAPKTAQGKSILYVKVSSTTDLCRYCCGYDFNTDMLLRAGEGSSRRLVALGEQAGNVTIGYYVETKEEKPIIIYKFPEFGKWSESIEFVESVDPQPGNYISVIDISFKDIRKAKRLNAKDVMQVEMRKPDSIVNAAIRKGMRNESLPYLYSFEFRKKRILCGFDLIEGLNDDKRILYYAVIDKKESSGFIRWSYTANRFDFTDVIGEYSYIYVKIINLAEPFSFFKMPD